MRKITEDMLKNSAVIYFLRQKRNLMIIILYADNQLPFLSSKLDDKNFPTYNFS